MNKFIIFIKNLSDFLFPNLRVWKQNDFMKLILSNSVLFHTSFLIGFVSEGFGNKHRKYQRNKKQNKMS